MELENLLIPFKNKEIIITQGFNGLYSHKKIRHNIDQSYSLDFKLDVNTSIFAAKGGVIKACYDNIDSFYTGTDFELGKRHYANFVEVQHENGIFSCYQHFSKNSLAITKGQEIKKGDFLGYSGLSGWIGNNPHLHFSMYKRFSIKKQGVTQNQVVSFPFKFDNYKGELEDKNLKNN